MESKQFIIRFSSGPYGKSISYQPQGTKGRTSIRNVTRLQDGSKECQLSPSPDKTEKGNRQDRRLLLLTNFTALPMAKISMGSSRPERSLIPGCVHSSFHKAGSSACGQCWGESGGRLMGSVVEEWPSPDPHVLPRISQPPLK